MTGSAAMITDAPRLSGLSLSGLSPADIRRMAGFPGADSRYAFIPQLMARPDLAGRGMRQGVTLLSLDEQGILAALVYGSSLYGLLHLPFGPAPGLECPGASGDFSPASLLPLLDDFRLGWLPHERARSLGGHVWRPGELPAEAEGFAPVFATGLLARHMQGHARILEKACS